MDKYEYKLKTEQMLELMESGAYNKAAEIADTIDWKRVRNAAMLINVSDIYEKNEDYQKSYDVLNIAYHRAEGSRKVIYRLCALALKSGNVDEAIDYYDDFIQIAPKDPNQHILKYKILRARRAPIDQQIEALEEFKKAEYIEEWAFELAKLYQEAGMTAECLEECDDLILWFSEGNYVYKAMELKMRYKQLTPSQQEKYDHRYDKIESATEEIPDLTQYQAKKANTGDNPGATGIDETQQMFIPLGELDEDIEEGGSDEDVSSDSQNLEILPEPEDEVVKKLSEKGIGSTMKLEDALQSLLKPKSMEVPEDMSESEINVEKEEEIPELKTAIEEIESVIDLELVNELSGKNDKEFAFDADLEELKAEPLEASSINPFNAPEQEQSAEQELEETNKEVLNSEIAVNDEPERIEDTLKAENIMLDKDDPVDNDQMEGQLSLEDILQSWDNTDQPAEEESMVDKDKKAEPILPPDIQRMIDEIEGVLPEEPEPEPVRVIERSIEEPRENMGEITQQLRIDDIEAFLEDDEDLDLAESEENSLEEDYDEIEEDSYEEDYEELDEDFDEEDYEELDEDFDEEDYEELDEDFDEEDYEELEEDFDEEDYEELDEDSYEEDYEESDEDSYEEDYDELDEDSDEEDYGELDEAEYDADELDEDDLDKIEASFEEEFRINPDHADENDDREIPDDDDDNMDILSATTPLSRKETAKLIATGKTAPLPLDDISNALSMSDTGFIVHGRYDLETQSGIGTRAGLTDEQKKLFSYFVPVRGMSEQLVDVLEQDLNCTNRNGTSKTGNLLIIGNKGNGKTVLAVDIVKAIQKQRNIRQGKVAIVTGESLNKKKISDIVSKLHGGALIIEKSGKLNEKTVARLNKAMERDTGEMLIVLEEQRKPLDRLLSSNREFRRKFTSRLEVPIFINDELVTFGQTYAQENGYRIDEMGILALYSRIDTLQREDHAVTVAEVKEVMDEAMEHSQKASAKKLVRRVFGKNTDDSDRIILSEKDFNI